MLQGHRFSARQQRSCMLFNVVVEAKGPFGPCAPATYAPRNLMFGGRTPRPDMKVHESCLRGVNVHGGRPGAEAEPMPGLSDSRPEGHHLPAQPVAFESWRLDAASKRLDTDCPYVPGGCCFMTTLWHGGTTYNERSLYEPEPSLCKTVGTCAPLVNSATHQTALKPQCGAYVRCLSHFLPAATASTSDLHRPAGSLIELGRIPYLASCSLKIVASTIERVRDSLDPAATDLTCCSSCVNGRTRPNGMAETRGDNISEGGSTSSRVRSTLRVQRGCHRQPQTLGQNASCCSLAATYKRRDCEISELSCNPSSVSVFRRSLPTLFS